MSRRFPVVPALVTILVALAIAAVAAAGWRSEPQAASPQLNIASKQLRLVQTQANKALIKLSNAKPGRVARGTTLVTTTGTTANVTIGSSGQRLRADIRRRGLNRDRLDAVSRTSQTP